MASIYWRNGRAWGRTRHKGQEIRQPLGTTSKREAARLLQTWVADLKGKKHTDGSNTSFEDAVDLFLETHAGTLKESSQKRYMLSLLTMAPFFKGRMLNEITRGVLAEFVTWRRKLPVRKGRKGCVTPGTIRRDLACLSSVFTIADDFERCDTNPVPSFMKRMKKRGLVEAAARTRYLSHDEEERIVQECYRRYQAYVAKGYMKRAHTMRMIVAAIILSIDLGLRDEELLSLRRPQVDFGNNEVTVLASQSKNGKERKVPMTDRARGIMESLTEHKNSALVLWHRGGVGFYDLNHTLKKIGAAVGVTGIRWHDLRRTCGCRLIQDRRFPMERVSKWLGHSSVKQTEKTYAFLDVRHLHAELHRSRTKTGTRLSRVVDKSGTNSDVL